MAHRLKNLRDYVDAFFKRKHVWLSELASPEKSEGSIPGQVEVKQPELLPLAASSSSVALTEAKTERPPTKEAQLKAERYENRVARYEQVRQLSEDGQSNREIARQLKVDKNTVNSYLQAEDAEEAVGSKPRPVQSSLIDPYKVYLYERWREEQPTIAELHQELVKRGYTGSIGPIRAFLARLRPKSHWSATRTKQRQHLTAEQIPGLASQKKLGSREASWLVFKLDIGEEKLTQEQRQRLQQLRKKDSQIEKVYQLVQKFRLIVRGKGKAELAKWLKRAKSSKIKELVSFSNGIERDRAAVEAGLSSEYSNGQLEGQVNRVKNIKRQMYGRAKFKLLRIRILA
jgi:transposase